MAESKFPTANLMCITSTVVFVIIIPASYQIVIVNQPFDVLQAFINDSFSAHYGYSLSDSAISMFWGFTLAITGVTGILAALIAFSVHKRFGSKLSLWVLPNGTLLVGSILQSLAKPTNSFELFIVGHILASGFGWVFAFILAPLYIAECSPPGKRGMTGTLLSFGSDAGYLLAFVLGLSNILGTEELWPYLMALTAPVSLLGVILTIFVPDTPKELFMRHKDTERSTAKLLNFYGSKCDTSVVLKDFEEEDRHASVDFHILDVFRSKQLRKPLMVTVVTSCLSITSGPAAMLVYSTMFFSDVQHGHDGFAQLFTILMVLPIPILVLIASYRVEKWGRRPLLLGGGLIMELLLTGYVVFALLAYHLGQSWLGYTAYGCAILNAWMGPFGPNAISVYLVSELFPQNARTAGSTVTMVSSNLVWSVLAYIIPPLHSVCGAWTVLITMVLPSVVCLAFLYGTMPETKGKSNNEIFKSWASQHKDISPIDAIVPH